MLYLLTGIGLILFVVAIAALIGLVRSGQLDDLDTPPARMLADDVPASAKRTAASVQRPASQDSP
jgi:cbb3-type cytochrome oxidase maturation protein